MPGHSFVYEMQIRAAAFRPLWKTFTFQRAKRASDSGLWSCARRNRAPLAGGNEALNLTTGSAAAAKTQPPGTRAMVSPQGLRVRLCISSTALCTGLGCCGPADP